MTIYQLMYEFQKDLLFDNAVEKAAEIASYRLHTKESLSDKAVEKHSATKEEQLAMLIDAAEQALPHEVLYPEPGAVTEVDERTGRAVRSIWRETAEIYGGIQASELADLRSNPLCRGIYLFEAQGLTTPSRIVIWNNTQGNGVPNYLNNPNDWSLAHAAAHIAAINGAGISSVQYAIRDLRNADLNIEKAFDDLLQDARAAIERAIAGAFENIVQHRGAPAREDMRELAELAARYDSASEINDSLGMDWSPLRASEIVEDDPKRLDALNDEETCRAFAEGCLDYAASHIGEEFPMMNSLISNLKKGIIWDEIGLGDQFDGVAALAAAYTRCEATMKDCEQIEASR